MSQTMWQLTLCSGGTFLPWGLPARALQQFPVSTRTDGERLFLCKTREILTEQSGNNHIHWSSGDRQFIISHLLEGDGDRGHVHREPVSPGQAAGVGPSPPLHHTEFLLLQFPCLIPCSADLIWWKDFIRQRFSSKLLPFQFAGPAWLSKGYRFIVSVKKRAIIWFKNNLAYAELRCTPEAPPLCSRARDSPCASAELLPPHHPSIHQVQCPGPLKQQDEMLRLP